MMIPYIYDNFEGASAVTIGRNHLYTGAGLRKALISRNGQDGVFSVYSDDSIVTVVTDGCSGGAHSGSGAQIGARLVVESIRRNLLTHVIDIDSLGVNSPGRFLERVRLDTIAQLRVLAVSMGLGLTQTVFDYFLFTVVGAIISPKYTTTFSIGDGVIFVNGESRVLGPFPDNTPPYLAYGITGSKVTTEYPELLYFQVQKTLATDELWSLLLGTDGASCLIDAAEKAIPGKAELVGPISQFWKQDRYFTNGFALRQRLNLINRDHSCIDWTEHRVKTEYGHLKDDVAISVVRKRKEPIKYVPQYSGDRRNR